MLQELFFFFFFSFAGNNNVNKCKWYAPPWKDGEIGEIIGMGFL